MLVLVGTTVQELLRGLNCSCRIEQFSILGSPTRQMMSLINIRRRGRVDDCDHATSHGVLFQSAPARGCFSRIVNVRLGTADLRNILAGQRCDSQSPRES